MKWMEIKRCNYELISLYCSKKDFESAKIYLKRAQEKLPFGDLELNFTKVCYK